MHSTHWEDLPGFVEVRRPPYDPDQAPALTFITVIQHPKGQGALKKFLSLETRIVDVSSSLNHDDRARVWHATAYTVREHGVEVEYIDLEESHFPNGYVSMLLTTYPGCEWPLPFVYRIYVDPGNTGPPPFNTLIAKRFKRPWFGHVVIARYSRSHTPEVKYYANMARLEHEWIFGTVGAWVSNMWTRTYGRPPPVTEYPPSPGAVQAQARRLPRF
ncbi:hypothetical protein DFP72DRAFT_854017 [Ephemerocybe angulata]|uniref:Uncharacterized protein n=1 Tax=Ephemerocybe angulata TaxID=980116 RepID=A0A8H6M0I5_9AGAR|nr:hypothetical protein DFP72DRAFT_854017 [Tulosesus angulatus]